MSIGQRYRTSVCVTGIEDRKNGRVLRVLVSGWSLDVEVRVPLSDLPDAIQELVGVGTRLFVYANLGAQDISDLHLDKFKIADEPDTEDGLG